MDKQRANAANVPEGKHLLFRKGVKCGQKGVGCCAGWAGTISMGRDLKRLHPDLDYHFDRFPQAARDVDPRRIDLSFEYDCAEIR